MPTAIASHPACHGTCRATCSILVIAAGGGNLFPSPQVLVVACLDPVRLIVGVVALSFLVHDEELLLPFIVGLGNSDADIGNDPCVAVGDSSSDGSENQASWSHIIVSPSQLRLSFQLLEIDDGGIRPHLQFSHPLLVNFFDGGIPELGLEFPHEVIPMGVLESWSIGIPQYVSRWWVHQLRAHSRKWEVTKMTMRDKTPRN